jgi:RNase P subunit RPR2
MNVPAEFTIRLHRENKTRKCDVCDGEYAYRDRWEVRIPRPSDPSDMSCILWVCAPCGPRMGARTPAQWDEYIESPEALEAGHYFLS